MADQTLSTVSSALSQLYAPKLVSQFNRLSVLTAALPKKVGKGKNVAWDVHFSAGTAASYSDGADVSTYDVDTPVAATLSWGLYRTSFSVSGLAQAAAASSVGSAAELMALIETNAATKGMKLASTLNADFFTGTSAIVGLESAVAGSGTYAGVVPGTYSEWVSSELANGGVSRALTKSLLDNLEEDIYEACGMAPDLIVTTPAIARKYESLLDANSRWVVPTGDISAVQSGNGARSVLNDHSGFTGLAYKGIPIFRDRNCPAGKLFMLNRSFIDIEVLPQPGTNTATVEKAKELAGEWGANALGMLARIEAMAKTGDSDKFTMKVYCQMAVRRRNAHGILKDILET
jgi:hypothetical protein